MKFKVGDKVRVKSEKEIRKMKQREFPHGFSHEMYEYCSTILIVRFSGDYCYRLGTNDWAWDENMITRPYGLKDKIKLIKELIGVYNVKK
jgi:hypothetical protein